MVSEKKKASNAKWDRENTRVVGVKLRVTQADAFRDVCTRSGASVYSALKAYVDACVREGALLVRAEDDQEG